MALATDELIALRARVRGRPLPRHVAVIMDGNGRWATQRGLPRLAGHREGSQSVRAVTRAARELGVKALTLYAFSSQNWLRPPTEVAGLMELLRDYLESERREVMQNNVRLRAIGELSRLPRLVRAPLDALIADSAHHDGLQLVLALSYGGREELVSAARRLAREVLAGKLAPRDIDEARLRGALDTGDLPDPDLVIRTSGERRLSNFLLFQIAYAELAFVDVAWPEFREAELLQAIDDYQGRERRFGKTGAQVKAK